MDSFETDQIANLTSLTNKLSLAYNRMLYLDVANMQRHFFCASNHWDIQGSIAKIEKFIKACHHSGWKLKGFLDFHNSSTEAFETSKNRRIREITIEKKEFPGVLFQIFEAVCTRFGVEIHSNLEADCDDTLASWAQKDGAAVFSADKDFFRYIGKKYEVYNRFTYEKNGIEFSYYIHFFQYDKPQRYIIDPPPKTVVFDKSNGYDLSYDFPEIRYGCASSLVKYLGNPYIQLRPLRKAMIFRLKGKPRKERIPYWNKILRKVEWDETLVEGSPEFDYLLNDRYKAVEEIFHLKDLMKIEKKFDEIKWRNHIFAIYSITFQICSMIEKNSDEKLIEWLIEAKKKIYGDEIEKICLKCKDKFYTEKKYYKFCNDCQKNEFNNVGDTLANKRNMIFQICFDCNKEFVEKEQKFFKIRKQVKCYQCQNNQKKELDFNFRNKNKE